MKSTISFTLLLLFSTILFSQETFDSAPKRKLNNLNLNIFGGGALYGFDYERLFFVSDKFLLVGKVGLGYTESRFNLECDSLSFPGSPDYCKVTPNRFLVIPYSFSANFGTGVHFFELGIGGSAITGATGEEYFVYPTFGYRFEPMGKKANFRFLFNFPISPEASQIQTRFILFGLNFGFSL